MKIATPEQQQGYFDATVKGSLKGGLFSIGISVPAYFILKNRSPFFRALTPPLKALAFVAIVVPCITISGEKAGEAYERSQWTGIGKRELDAVAKREEERWEQLSVTDRIGDYAKRNRYGIIAGSWAAAMGGSFALVSRNKYQSFSQKIVQARVYAQAWTILLLLAAAIASGASSDEDVVTPRNSDHSWQDILEQEGYLKESDKVRLNQLKGAADVAAPKKGGE